MKIIRDCFDQSARLTDERTAHIFQLQEMADMESDIEQMLQVPAEVRVSRSDHTVQLFHEFYTQTLVGGKWLGVVSKVSSCDAFVVTAYLTDQLKVGETIWSKK